MPHISRIGRAFYRVKSGSGGCGAMWSQSKDGPDRVLHSIVVFFPKEPQFSGYRGPLDGGNEALRNRWALQAGRLPISDLTVTKVHTIKLRRKSDNYGILAGRVITRAAHDNGGAGLAPQPIREHYPYEDNCPWATFHHIWRRHRYPRVPPARDTHPPQCIVQATPVLNCFG